MTTPIVSLADSLTALGITAGADPAVDAAVSGLVDAISAEVRRLTRRAYEGAATVYDEVYRIDGARFITLPHAPLDVVIALRRAYFDGSEDPIETPNAVTGGESTALSADAAIGATNLKVDDVADLTAGDLVQVGSYSSTSGEVVRVSAVGTAGSGGTGLTIEPALRYAHSSGEAVLDVSGSDSWRVDDATLGRLELRPEHRLWRFRSGVIAGVRADYVRVTYRVTGDVPADVTQAFKDWLKVRWNEAQDETEEVAQTPDLASQSSDSWSESYRFPAEPATAGVPPRHVSRVLLGNWHGRGGGVI